MQQTTQKKFKPPGKTLLFVAPGGFDFLEERDYEETIIPVLSGRLA